MGEAVAGEAEFHDAADLPDARAARLARAQCTPLFESNTLQVDHFHVEGPGCRGVAFTFTGWGHRNLSGYGYGSHFLIKEGFDVVAFKLIVEDWYQSVPESLLEQINRHVAGFHYHRRLAYGSSMGGYAAIQFARVLDCDTVLAFSPQFRIDQAFDTDYAVYVPQIKFRYFISPATVRPDTQYFLAYDRRMVDRLHVQRIMACIPPAQVRACAIPWAGHPVDTFLQSLGLLKQLVRRVFVHGDWGDFDFRASRAHSAVFLGNLSLALARRNRNQAALDVIERGLLLAPDAPRFHCHRIALLERLGRHADMRTAAEDALARLPQAPELHVVRSRIRSADGQLQDALRALVLALRLDADHPEALALLAEYRAQGHDAEWRAALHADRSWETEETPQAELALREALAHAPQSADLHARHAVILGHLRRIDEAIQAARAALLCDPAQAPVWLHLSYLLADAQQPEAALEAVERYFSLQEAAAVAHVHRGALLEQLGRVDEAVVSVCRSLVLDVGNVDTRQYLQHLLGLMPS